MLLPVLLSLPVFCPCFTRACARALHCSGDTMNTASRMETCCKPGCVHVSDAFAKLLPHEDWNSTGGVQVCVRAWL